MMNLQTRFYKIPHKYMNHLQFMRVETMHIPFLRPLLHYCQDASGRKYMEILMRPEKYFKKVNEHFI